MIPLADRGLAHGLKPVHPFAVPPFRRFVLLVAFVMARPERLARVAFNLRPGNALASLYPSGRAGSDLCSHSPEWLPPKSRDPTHVCDGKAHRHEGTCAQTHNARIRRHKDTKAHAGRHRRQGTCTQAHARRHTQDTGARVRNRHRRRHRRRYMHKHRRKAQAQGTGARHRR